MDSVAVRSLDFYHRWRSISNEDLITSQLDNLSSTNSESIWTQTQIKGIVICTFYRPPKDTQGFQLDELDHALSKLGNLLINLRSPRDCRVGRSSFAPVRVR